MPRIDLGIFFYSLIYKLITKIFLKRSVEVFVNKSDATFHSSNFGLPAKPNINLIESSESNVSTFSTRTKSELIRIITESKNEEMIECLHKYVKNLKEKGMM